MKKLTIALIALIFTACSSVDPAEVDRKLVDSIEQTMAARGISNLNVSAERLHELESPKGYYLYKVIVSDGSASQEQYFFFDGNYIVSDFVKTNGASLSKELLFDYVTTDIDVSGLSLMYGNKNAKNIIVKITDVECPYCREAYKYIDEKVQGRDDVAVYIAHYPLKIHKNAVIDARIFEAGLMVGMNFAHELFTNDDLLKMENADIRRHFENLVDVEDRAAFLDAIDGDQVNQKLIEGQKTASAHGVTSTPTIFINGKKVSGFDKALIDRAFEQF